MASITSTTGLISGINTSDIIDKLMALEAQPKTTLETRQKTLDSQKSAFKALVTQLQKLQTTGRTLERPTTFSATTATSSDENVLTATTAAGAAPGSYQFQVARLVTSQQSVTKGFTDYTTASVGAGTITIEMGGGEVSSQTLLADLNGGTGVNRGVFRITDRAGNASVIDVTNAVSLDDVVKKINTSLELGVRASISNDHLVLTDTTGSSSQQITVADLADGTAAAGLGIVGSGSGTTLTGTDINKLGIGSALSTLNDGLGVRTSLTGADITVTTADNSTFDFDLGTARTLGDVFNTISSLSAGKLTASVDAGGNGIRLVDNTSGGGMLTVTADAGSNAAKDLGLLGQTPTSGAITGQPLLASIDSTLIKTLNGGNGLTLGQMVITDRTGTSRTVNLANATSVQDILDTISNQTGIAVTAKLNSAGNGIAIVDDSGGTGNLTIADASDGTTTATLLGLAQSVDTTKTQLNGKNLQRQWVNENTLLSKYNGGKGVTPGSFKITNAAGLSKEFNVSQASKIGDIISTINAGNLGVTAAVNANGDGLLLTDTTGGANKLKVENVSGTTASDLGIAGTATLTTIDGSFEKSLILTSADTLTTVQNKINSLGFGARASVLNDGSAGSPFRLSLTAVNTGRAGRVVLDMGTTELGTQNLVDAQDAAVFVGGATGGNSLLVTASGNSLAGVLPGITLNLNSISDKPVTLSITRDSEGIVDQMTSFTTDFNDMVDGIKELTKFDPDTQEKGLLFADATMSTVQQQLYASLNTVVAGAGRYRIFADVGVTLDDETKITFDEDKFRKAYADDPEAVKNLFTQVSTGLGAALEKSMAKLIDPVDGAITRRNKTLDDQHADFQDRIDRLDKQLDSKRTRLETQFANMETVLAKLQSQQSSLSQMSSISYSSK